MQNYLVVTGYDECNLLSNVSEKKLDKQKKAIMTKD